MSMKDTGFTMADSALDCNDHDDDYQFRQAMGETPEVLNGLRNMELDDLLERMPD